MGRPELHPRRDPDGCQRDTGRGSKPDHPGARLGRRRRRLGRRHALCRAGADCPRGTKPQVLRPGARRDLVQHAIQPVYGSQWHRRTRHVARQPDPARGRVGARDRAHADADHDRHRCLQRRRLRTFSPPWLPLQPAPCRHRRDALLADRSPRGLRRSQRARAPARQHEPVHRELGRHAASDRLAQTWASAGDGHHALAPGRRPTDAFSPSRRRIRSHRKDLARPDHH